MDTRVYNELTSLVNGQLEFAVVQCTSREDDNGKTRHATKLRAEVPEQKIDGIPVPATQLTLYVASSAPMEKGEVINLNPDNWEYTLTEFTPEGSDETINLKWLRPRKKEASQ